MKTLKNIIDDAGGVKAIAAATKGTIKNNDTIYKWVKNGVRVEYWPLLLRLTKANDNPVTVCEIYKATIATIKAGQFSDKRRRK
ncbi:MAG: hypothetical protein COB36_12285 [Alphaproteobacteria bacterium]|nr:MAG: hypothetical protein COB36_12285 [Alphaproteobacteria bacterium]